MKNKNIIVIGLGISGRAAVKLAAAQGCVVIGIDEKSSLELDAFSKEMDTQQQVTILTGLDSCEMRHFLSGTTKNHVQPGTAVLQRKTKSYTAGDGRTTEEVRTHVQAEPAVVQSNSISCESMVDFQADLIVMSPGVADDSFLGKLAIETGVEITSELDFAARFISVPILAITGTNGKTTVTEMTTGILQKAGVNAISAGNIGLPLSDVVGDDSLEVIVVEASSFQLEKVANFAALAASVLNIESDHMDRYATFADYTDAKLNIFANIAKPENMILNFNLLDIWKKRFGSQFNNLPITFSSTDQRADIVLENGCIESKNNLSEAINLKGSEISSLHNIENLMVAAALASSILDKAELQKAVAAMICEFRISQHRQEVILEKDGVTFVNDSKATNPSAMISALEHFGKEQNICLIAGGLDKKMDFSSIKNQKDKIKAIFLAGESKKLLATLWNDDIHCIVCGSFEESVTKAVACSEPGDVVLLSPGCASMDMFKNYKERGEKFKQIIYDIL